VLLDANMPEMDGFAVAQAVAERPSLAGATVMMLTSSGEYGDAARCRALGIAAYLVKPVRQSDLHEAIVRALSERPPTPGALDTIAPPDVHAPVRQARVLLAEDNLVNQRVAMRLLTARGHRVTLVDNGRAAVEAAAREPFDVVLMDIQMPEMGGLEATGAIRAREAQTGGHLRIVAMTAHALKGDRERCLDAGMDEYLTKPIDRLRLFAAVEQDPAPAPPAAERRVFDAERIPARFSGDVDLFREVGQLFLEACPDHLAAIRRAAADGDWARFGVEAHTLKGAAGTVGAEEVAAAAEALERLKEARQPDAVRAQIARLESTCTDFVESLRGFLSMADV